MPPHPEIPPASDSYLTHLDRFAGDGAVQRGSGLWVPRGQAEELGPPEAESRAEYVISEIDSSLSFVNVEFIVCTALLLFKTESLRSAPVVGLALFTAFIFFLFGGLSFAVAGGEVARGPRGVSAAKAALELGNVLSEWFGLYMLVLASPVVVQVSVGSIWIGAAAVVITLSGYFSYVLSRYDLLGRFLSGIPRIVAHILFAALVAADWYCVAKKEVFWSYVSGGLYVALCLICAIIHRKRGEF